MPKPTRLSSLLMQVGLLTLVGASGCIQAALSAGQPTAVERQLLGAYEELDEELVHASSVRGPGLEDASHESLQQLALRARSLQVFNADDVLELKSGGCMYETLRAELAAIDCDLVNADAAATRRRTRVIDEENRARRVLMRWAAHEIARREGRAVPDSNELAEVRAAYVRLVKETAQPGHLMEVTPGDVQPMR